MPGDLPQEVATELAVLACIIDGDAYRDFFVRNICDAVRYAWRLDVERHDAAQIAGPALRKAVQAALALADALTALDNDEQEQVARVFAECNRQASWFLGYGKTEVALLARRLASVVTNAAGDYRDIETNRGTSSHARGRRGPRTDSLDPLSMFVMSLFSAAEFSGGRFSLEKNIRAGAIFTALELLRPYLPPGFVRALSPSTLQRLKSAARVPADLVPRRTKKPSRRTKKP